MTIRIALIGFGKIAQDEHWPSIRANSAFELVALAGGRGQPPTGIRRFADHRQMLANMGNSIDAVAICTPPGARYTIARDCLLAGVAVLLEKPPAATLGALADLVGVANKCGQTLYATWHSQHAPAVRPAAAALAGQSVQSLSIDWLEDVRRWHPGQDWVLGAGGFGVLDPGINALSIVSRILPEPVLIASAQLLTPANRQSPIAAEIGFDRPQGRAVFDWRVTGAERRTIMIETEDGILVELGDGGNTLAIDSIDQNVEASPEYPSIYARFAELIGEGAVEVDAEPLRLVADAFLIGTRETTAAFD